MGTYRCVLRVALRPGRDSQLLTPRALAIGAFALWSNIAYFWRSDERIYRNRS